MRALLVAATLLVGCGGNSAPMDAAVDHLVLDLSINSICGHPGDVGNSVGVGKFCTVESDCSGNTLATICTQLDPTSGAYFCTVPCTAGDGGTNCGENAHCACGSGGSQSGCGCYPDSCP